MADDFGTDFAGVNDIDANWTYQTNGSTVVQEAIARRLICSIGGLFYDKTYGYDVRSALADIHDPDLLARSIDAEAKKDERVASSLTTILINEDGSMHASVSITPATGTPFAFTLKIGDSTIALLTNA